MKVVIGPTPTQIAALFGTGRRQCTGCL